MRAIYIAKGSSLLPPSFASIFDDSAFSSLDVFFDPSSSLHSLPGLTVGSSADVSCGLLHLLHVLVPPESFLL